MKEFESMDYFELVACATVNDEAIEFAREMMGSQEFDEFEHDVDNYEEGEEVSDIVKRLEREMFIKEHETAFGKHLGGGL